MAEPLINGTPLNVLLQQAAALKTEQMAPDRKKYDSYSSWLKNSFFANEVTLPLHAFNVSSLIFTCVNHVCVDSGG